MSSSLRFLCPHCGALHGCRSDQQGDLTRCGICHSEITIPEGFDVIPDIHVREDSIRSGIVSRRVPQTNGGTYASIVVGLLVIAIALWALLSLDPRETDVSPVTGLLGGAGLLVLAIGLYVIPVVIACRRGHPNALPIAVLTLLLGWSLVGWVAALVWSLTAIPSPRRG